MQILSNWYVNRGLIIGHIDDEADSTVLSLDKLMNYQGKEFKQGSVLIFPDRVYKLGRPYKNTPFTTDLGTNPCWVSMVRDYVVEADRVASGAITVNKLAANSVVADREEIHSVWV